MLNRSIDIMAARLQDLLSDCHPTMVLLGSVVLEDFQFGWSDIDFLLLTARSLGKRLAESVLSLRETLSEEENGNPFFRLFEGVTMTRRAFFERGETDGPVVYWGTTGQRILSEYSVDPFAKIQLLKSSRLLFGEDFRHLLSYPSRSEIVRAVRQHYITIRRHGHQGGGWLLDISRCLYTLQTNDVIAKTKAGEWALSQHLCPHPQVMERVLEVRKNPQALLARGETQAWWSALGPYIQAYADVLEAHLRCA